MARISDCCDNLNPAQSLSAEELIGDDITSTISVDSSGVLIAPADNNRRLIKIFVISISGLGELWIRHGSAISFDNAAFKLPPGFLLTIDSSQARGNVSAICSSLAQLRVSLASKI